ncbi:hypothetical protein C7293_13695 [filamentous cyanobacterium CCT1]|nr:hypothetical protein C7293_13695 [filamentous cyanobacterium CCT1]PSN80400.1 hypothetical protein C8B47_06750 [filamentous cyanobacterium CCP4]
MAKINLLPVILACGAVATLARIGTANLDASPDSTLAAASAPTRTSQATATTTPEGEPLQGQALVVSEAQNAIAAGVYARAHYLLGKGRESGNAAQWLADYQAKVSTEVSRAQQSTGLFTGEAELFSTASNRAGELAAVATALLWLEHPELADKPPAFTLAALVEAVSNSTTEGNPNEN